MKAIKGEQAVINSKLYYEQMVQWETIDTCTNKLNNNVVIVDCIPQKGNQKGANALDVAKMLLRNLDMPPHTLKIAFFIPMGSTTKPSNFPKLKIIMAGSEEAYEFRSRGYEKRREERAPWVDCYVSNELTKSTRVRIEVMKRIGDKIKNTEGKGFDLVVNKFDIKPVLMYKEGKKIAKRIPYVECVERWGKLLKTKDLELARKIAGKDLGKRFEVMFGV